MTKFINLTGQRFDRLVALKPTIKRQDKSVCWECLCDCGNITIVSCHSLRSGNTKSCGCLKRDQSKYRLSQLHGLGIHNPHWKGGKNISSSGYIFIYMPEHPNAKGKYVREHHLVMSQYLGRPIDTKKEEVHHKNGIKSDNRLENLELKLLRAHGPGQSVYDRVLDAVEIIKNYAPHLLKESVA